MRNTCSCCLNAISLLQVEDVSHLDEVISFVDLRLHAVLTDTPSESTSATEIAISDRVQSYINYGKDLLDNVARRVRKHACRIMKLNHDSRKVIIYILKGAGQIHWVGAGLAFVACVLNKMSNPCRGECVDLLHFMCGLAKHIRRLIDRLPQEKLEDVVVLLVKGSFFCFSLMETAQDCRIFRALMDDEEINSLQSELCDKHRDLKFLQDKDSEEDDKQNTFNLPEEDVLSGLDELMAYIEKCLEKSPSSDKAEEITSEVASSINYGSRLLKKVLKSRVLESVQTRKAVIDVLKEASQIHWLAAGLSVVAFVLDKINDASTNRQECEIFLRYMYCLAKQLKQLKRHIPSDKLHDVTEFILEGSFFCVSRMKSSNLSRFFYSEVDVEKIESLRSELSHKYQDLTMDAVTKILKRMPTVLPLSQGQYPIAVGIDKARDEVIGLLHLRDQSVRTVVLYGVGGIGKTLLATAVFSYLDLDAYSYKYCRVDIIKDCKESDLVKLQKQVLNDLFSQNIKLRSCKDGRDALSTHLRKSGIHPLFLFIDNGLRGSDLTKLLPDDLSCLPDQSRILITTRHLDETDVLLHPLVKRYPYMVENLSMEDSKKLLCLRALGCADNSFDESLDIDGLVKNCGCVPLMLEMVGKNLSQFHNNISGCEKAINDWKYALANGEGEMYEHVVDEVYKDLKQNDFRDAFLDIAAFFNDWDQRTVGFIVGELALKAVQEAALIKISEEGMVIFHDIVQARGRKLSEEDRITDMESLRSRLQDTQGLEKLKGVFLPSKSKGEPIFQLQAERLDKMYKCLRVLYLGEGVKIIEECTQQFRNLCYLHIGNGDCSPILLNKLPSLKIFEGRLRSDDSFNGLSDSLRRLRVEDLESLGLNEDFGKLCRLEELDLSQNENSMKKEGKIWRATHYMKSLPQSFGHLKSLRSLNLYCFKDLSSLPDNFDQLRKLEKLKIHDCPQLSSLSVRFGQLSNLKELIIRGCTKLCSLSDDFGSLRCVVAIVASGCPVLSAEALDQMIELKSLMLLNINESPLLIHRWKEIEERHPLLVWTGTRGDTQPSHSMPSNEGAFEMVKKIVFEHSMPSNEGAFEMLKKTVFEHSMSRALSHVDSRFVNVDGMKADLFSTFVEAVAFEMVKKIVFEHSMSRALFHVDSRFVNVDGMKAEWVSTFLEAVAFEMVKKIVFKHSMSRALFHVDSRFVNVDGVKADWFSTFPEADEDQVAFLVTCCDLCSPTNEKACEIVKEKLELSCDGCQLVYVGLMEQTEESICEILRHLSQGISGGASLCAWIPPTPCHKWKEFFAFSAHMLTTLEDGIHTVIAHAHFSASEAGNPQVQDFRRIFPEEGNVYEKINSPSDFSSLYSPLLCLLDYF